MRQTQCHTGRQRDRQRHTGRQTDTDTQAGRQTETDNEGQRDKERRDRHRDTQKGKFSWRKQAGKLTSRQTRRPQKRTDKKHKHITSLT